MKKTLFGLFCLVTLSCLCACDPMVDEVLAEKDDHVIIEIKDCDISFTQTGSYREYTYNVKGSFCIEKVHVGKNAVSKIGINVCYSHDHKIEHFIEGKLSGNKVTFDTSFKSAERYRYAVPCVRTTKRDYFYGDQSDCY